MAAVLLGALCPNEASAALDPIRITSFLLSDEGLSMDWEGGAPPFRVQFATASSGWQDLTGVLFEPHYSAPLFGDFALFRVRTAPDLDPPAVPAGFAILATNCRGTALRWNPSYDGPDGTGVIGYTLYRDGAVLTNLPASSTYFFDRSTQPNSSYSYAVQAVDLMTNRSEPSPALVVSTPPCVQGSQDSPTGQIILSWDPSEERDVAGYLIYWGLRPHEYSWVVDAMDLNSAIISDLVPGELYFFAVTAYARDDVESDFSIEVAVITSLPTE